ncbi:MAG: amidophosphoribosyltransferase [Lentisphaerae bacterium]|nr:amidophosphoribosyltransferase [Victivallaceae bacterium]MDD3703282.1 amidophosphoribosyltransferase [Victivallaceae bacterium]MDD5663828.1 amidophosphoribosyltransferase [Victivallaceae bacterium]NLK82906.1 amidophosphoribosyltransferase [Lentisphaerota bacterium]
MGGFFGVVSKSDCVCDLFYGTDYHSHLGTRRGGMAVMEDSLRTFRVIHDITNAQFRSKFDCDLDSFKGHIGIGIISDYEDQPLIITSHLGTFTIVTVGRITNSQELIQESFRRGIAQFSEMNYGEINPTELVASLINRKSSIVEGIAYAQEKIEGSCSMLVMADHGIYAARDRYGRTPLYIGNKDGAHAVTMETSAFPNLDYDEKYRLGPGEICFITADQIIQKKAPGSICRTCAFFWVYFGYPSSNFEGKNTETVRYKNGELLARGETKEVDSVCGIPDSGVGHALGFANASGICYRRAFVKYTPTWARSFMPQNQSARDIVSRMKLIPVIEQVKGKKLLFCDDSVVRGTQMRGTAERLRKVGVKEVHVRSACPPLLFSCKYLNFSRSKSEMDLAARRAIRKLEGDNPDINIAEYVDAGTSKHQAMVEEIRRELNLDSLRYQTLENMIEAIGLPEEQLCTYCWSGRE